MRLSILSIFRWISKESEGYAAKGAIDGLALARCHASERFCISSLPA